MAPPKPPPGKGTPPRQSSAALPVEQDVVVPGAVHPLRPILPPAERPTSPPPAADKRPAPRTSLLGVRVPSLAERSLPAPNDTDEGTLPGVGPSSVAPDSTRDSREITTDALLQEAAERGAKLRSAEAKIAQLERERAHPVPAPAADFDAVAYFQRWQVLGLKFFLPIAALLGAAGLAFSIWNKTTFEPKLEHADQKQEEQKKTTATAEARLEALEKYARALARHSDCVDAERDSAIERGTGHKVETDHDDVQWVEQNKPAPVPRVLWKSAPWSIAKDQPCPVKPAPPTTPLQP